MLLVSTSRNDCTLGVMYITQVCRVAYMHLSNVRKIRNMLTDEAASQLIHSFITSRMDYCNKIQSLPKKLHWLPVRQRITYKIIMLTFKTYHKTAPQYIYDLIISRKYNEQLDQIIPLH